MRLIGHIEPLIPVRHENSVHHFHSLWMEFMRNDIMPDTSENSKGTEKTE